MIRIGTHLSISGGVSNSAVEADRMGYGAFQIFTSSSRTWKQRLPDKSDAKSFSDRIRSRGIVPFAHIPYLCNLASPNRDVLGKSVIMLRDNIESCNMLGIRYLVLHLGSHLGEGSNTGIKNIADSINSVRDSLGELTLLFENTSGYKNSVGSTFTEIGRVIEESGSEGIGICLDTCHAFAAGYDIRDRDGLNRMIEEIESNIGFDRLGLVHLNDSKFDLGSTKDRHWHIGKGYIGMKGFENLFGERHFSKGNFVLETPANDDGDDTTNMKAVRAVLKKVGLERDVVP